MMKKPRKAIDGDNSKLKSEHMSFCIEREMYQKFLKIAAVQKLSAPRLARIAVTEYVQRNTNLLQVYDRIWDSVGNLKINDEVEA